MRHRLLSPVALGITFALGAACDRQPTEPNPGSSTSAEPASAALADSLPPGTATGKHVTRYTANGDNAYFYSSDGANSMYVSVARYSDGTGSGTSLYYYLSRCSQWECHEVEAGYGTIPGADLKVTGSGHTSLKTNTAGPAFSRWAGAGGGIAIEWEPRRDYEARFHGTTDQRYGQVRYHSNGISTYRSASVTGTLIGHAVPSSAYSDGQVGSSKSKSVQIVAP
jgi:hypothetical protein